MEPVQIQSMEKISTYNNFFLICTAHWAAKINNLTLKTRSLSSLVIVERTTFLINKM